MERTRALSLSRFADTLFRGHSANVHVCSFSPTKHPTRCPSLGFVSLQEGHELTTDDIGETVTVGSFELTLVNITGNEAEISAPYVGDDVLEG